MDTKDTPPPPSNPNRNPNPINTSPSKPMLAFHFLRALSCIHRTAPIPRRSLKIRRAAYSSMARATSPRRAWSRALLRRLQSRQVRTTRARVSVVRRHVAPQTPRPGEPSRTDALRRLVPGGRAMEYGSLLEEAADYMLCLRAQVQLMQGLVDLFSCQ